MRSPVGWWIVSHRPMVRFVVHHLDVLDFYEVRRETAMSSTVHATFSDRDDATADAARRARAEEAGEPLPACRFPAGHRSSCRCEAVAS